MFPDNETAVAGSTVYTDDHRGYIGVGGLLYKHEAVKHSAKEYVRGRVHTNGIESCWALLKRAYMGTHHWWSPKHLHRYLAEFCGRFNNRKLDTIQQMSILAEGMNGRRLRYNDLISQPGNG